MKEQLERDKQNKQQAKKDEQLRFAKAQVKHVLSNETEAHAKSWIEDRSTASQAMTRVAIAELLADGTLVEADYLDGMDRKKTGLKLAK